MTSDPQPKKSAHAEREERILKFWKDKDIFGKSLAKPSPKGEFVFYEGPPTANGRPGIHHLEARAFKDAIPRYKTMRGFHVRRKGGWDTHGLPVEIQVEKELGLKSKKEIDSYGIEKFNEKCKESVWTFVHEWEDFTNRIGYWVDLKDPYITYKPDYMESLWNIMKHVDDQGLLYKDYKVVPWCPRCGTALSSHELAQGYADVKDLSVTVKLRIKGGQLIVYKPTDKSLGDQIILDTTKDKVYFLAWTTTPWTLPGNVGLAINANENYIVVEVGDEKYILAEKREKILSVVTYKKLGDIGEGNLLIDHNRVEYEPLYPFLKDNISGVEKDKLKNAYKVYAADFVTTEDGTGIVHTAVMYGQDDFELGNRVGLPKYHLVNEDGTFKKEAGFLAGKFVKSEETDVEIIKDLAHRGLLFHKEKYEHSYPFCWRCKTPLIYFARDSWYIRMSDLRHKLVKENESINWEPEHIKEGRFGEWLREVKDWAISRERYWGTPLPVWVCEKCGKRKVAGSVADVTKQSRNTYYVMRHGEAENNVKNILNSDTSKQLHLTVLGRDQVKKSSDEFKGKIDMVFCSPLLRAKETAEIFAETVGLDKNMIKSDGRLREMGMGELEGKNEKEVGKLFGKREEFFAGNGRGVENRNDQKKRTGAFIEDIDSKYEGKNILIVSHDSPLWMLESAAQSLDIQSILGLKPRGELYLHNAQIKKIEYTILPHNAEYELDLHRPYIDAVKLPCSCGGEMKRVKEVMDVWFDSGAMPFAQDHYPFENKKLIDGGLFRRAKGYPADFISEAIDQTRGWFYTLHAIGVLMGKGKAYKNVICLGHILDPQGKKMSKSVGNVVNPWEMMDKYGADALRFWMYSINQPGESKNFDEKTVDEIVKKVFNLIANTAAFYKMYADDKVKPSADSDNVLDRWIISRLNQLVENATKNLDSYVLLEPARAIRDFAADLSQWYLRRSRDRFKEEGNDKQSALATTRFVLLTLAKVMAPFTPFFAEEIYKDVGGEKESVHLEEWPVASKIDLDILAGMSFVQSFATSAHMERTKNKIPVRQPLPKFTIKHSYNPIPYWNDLKIVLMEEINVKGVFLDATASQDGPPWILDVSITPELKEEGDVRELLRKIQDLRKEAGLSVKDKAILVATNDLKDLIGKHGDEIKSATNLSGIEFGAEFGLK